MAIDYRVFEVCEKKVFSTSVFLALSLSLPATRRQSQGRLQRQTHKLLKKLGKASKKYARGLENNAGAKFLRRNFVTYLS